MQQTMSHFRNHPWQLLWRPSFGSRSSSTPNTKGTLLAPALPVQVGAGKALDGGTARSLLAGTSSGKQVTDMLGFALEGQVCLSAVHFQTKCLLQKAAKDAGHCWAQHHPGSPTGAAAAHSFQRHSSAPVTPWQREQHSSALTGVEPWSSPQDTP